MIKESLEDSFYEGLQLVREANNFSHAFKWENLATLNVVKS
jgi:hypothetical protein